MMIDVGKWSLFGKAFVCSCLNGIFFRLETFRICSLPREARLVLNVFGRKTVIVEKQTR